MKTLYWRLLIAQKAALVFLKGGRVGNGRGRFEAGSPPVVRARFIPVLAMVLALVALATCERIAGPDGTARPPSSGPEVQATVEALGEDPHMVALALEIPGFGGYWYESPGGRLVVALTADAGEGGFPAARRAVLTRLAAEVTHASPVASELIKPPPEVVERTVRYSFIELARHRARLRSALFAIPEVVSLAVDEELNRVVVGLEDMSGEASVLAQVADLGVPTEMIFIFAKVAGKDARHFFRDMRPTCHSRTKRADWTDLSPTGGCGADTKCKLRRERPAHWASLPFSTTAVWFLFQTPIVRRFLGGRISAIGASLIRIT